MKRKIRITNLYFLIRINLSNFFHVLMSTYSNKIKLLFNFKKNKKKMKKSSVLLPKVFSNENGQSLISQPYES